MVIQIQHMQYRFHKYHISVDKTKEQFNMLFLSISDG